MTALLPPLLAETGTVDSDGCAIRWWAGGEGGPTLVLVHGGGAHAGWWEPMLPALSARQRVIVLDLSGHGDSGRRAGGYPSLLWVEDVAAVIASVAGHPVALIGHSLGGRICTSVAARHPELISSLVTVDAVIPSYNGEPIPPVRPTKLYGTEDEVCGAFKLMPPQPPLDDPLTLVRLAQRSIIQRPDGRFTWKWDPEVFGAMEDRFVSTHDVPRLSCPVTLVQGGLSEVTTPLMAEQFAEMLGRAAEIITVAGAHHHIPLDSPAALDAVLLRLFPPAAVSVSRLA